jgi:ABC-2 type transport system permease protein
LFPLNNLPKWMTILTRLDPVTYGVSPVRAVALTASGVPSSTVTALTSITILGWTLPYAAEVGLLLIFGAAMLVVSMAAFRKRD